MPVASRSKTASTGKARYAHWIYLALGAALAVGSVFWGGAYLLPPQGSRMLQETDRPFANSRFVEIDGGLIHVRAWQAYGPERGCQVLLLHDFTSSTYAWDAFAPALARHGQRVIAIDLPGFGFSGSASWNDPISGLWRLLDGLAPKEARWCLIGHGMSAKFASLMAIREPERVMGLAYVGGLPWQSPMAMPWWQRWLLKSAPGRRWLAFYLEHGSWSERGIGATLQTGYGRALSQEELQRHLQPWQIKGQAVGMLAALHALDRMPLDAKALKRWAPLIIWGGADLTNPPTMEAVWDVQIALSRSTQLVSITGAGHFPMTTHSAELLPTLSTWMDRLIAQQASR